VEGTIRLALTGTPGTGKTTVSSLLSKNGFEVFSVESLAEKHNCIEDADLEDGARVIDMDELCEHLGDDWSTRPDTDSIIDGHLSHLLPVDCVINLRCKPIVLRERLIERGYSDSKIAQNTDWEILGGAWNELEEGVPVIEFDSTSLGPESIVGAILDWKTDGFKPNRPFNPIDWVGREEV
tara:strand:+ start:43 stop:585 length:543 start_codon:yes stop_codon:yes gene_type:complete